MNNEHLEHEIALLRNTSVILVCPHFGNVSFSYAGTLHIVNDHPVLFHLINDNGGIAIIFTVEDVNKLERGIPSPVIRLKGPHDYREDYSTV